MNRPSSTDFDAFFTELYGYGPFPWQTRLASRVCEGNWPKCIALPTAAGKTACIDIAVFTLACQANWPAERRTAPRRIFFVVDRRIVVDQAYEHAMNLADSLRQATGGVAKQVADALKSVGQMSDRPLDCYALRGGMYRESVWVRSPLQPTVITSTVDQVGSRLLFRGYGVSDSLKPIHAGLVGNDSLILLDEAHCAKPFDQTVTLVKKYRNWAEQPLTSPFHFVSMTATPSTSISETEIERDNDDDHNDKTLGPRLTASKPAQLIVAKKATGAKWRAELVKVLVEHARSLQDEGFRAVGVIVNRVATARETAAALREATKKDETSVILLTGRMRPMDRDKILRQLGPLFSGRSGALSRPTFVVATQCLEVGADLDFHALVTECASLDALRQRFGRLNRVAARSLAKAVVVIRGDQTEPTEDKAKQDPVYGNSLANTWQWLHDNKDGVAENGIPWIDFRIASIRQKWDKVSSEEREGLSAPTLDAAVLLPAHLDLWCQTSPIPTPDPDPAVFLHGPSNCMPDVQVVFRADLGSNPNQWAEIVALCPPSSAEALSVRLDMFRRWLAQVDSKDESSDVEGEPTLEVAELVAKRYALRWKWPNAIETKIVTNPQDVHPGDLFVVPATADANHLGDFPDRLPTDQADEGFQKARDRAILRLTNLVYETLPSFDGVEIEDDSFDEKLSDAFVFLKTDTRKLIRDAAKWLSKIKKSDRIIKEHPIQGFVVVGKTRLRQFDPTFIEAEESYESISNRPILLEDHCRDVAERARLFATGCALTEKQVDGLELAGMLHDAGKADQRFQAMLHGGNRRAADACKQKLAKSISRPLSPKEYAELRQKAGYPKGGRHELLSVRLSECDGVLPANLDDRDLILHLIATHHGCCRPFAPVVDDPNAEDVIFDYSNRQLKASSATLLERLDSGIAERFWKLTRRFGWWGLPWLESTLRLADWSASEHAAHKERPNEK